MGSDGFQLMEVVPSPRNIKVHRSMCTKVINLLNKVLEIFPEIEASRPRSSSGIQALCLLNGGIEKAKLLLQHCSEASKLYLAITGEAILSRCLKSRSLLEQSLCQIQDDVPVLLAAQISRVISDLRSTTFSLDSSEEAVGKAVKALLHEYASSGDSVENSAIETIRFATKTLEITSQKALLIEKRSIRKLFDEVAESSPAKKHILWYLKDLLNKYGQKVVKEHTENAVRSGDAIVESYQQLEPSEALTDTSWTRAPPEEFKCPISSRLMYEPVVIASGQTFERLWIEKWFSEGHDTCPKTKKKLAHLSLTPNVAMKDLISNWCKVNGVTIHDPCSMRALDSWEASSSSIASLSTSMADLHLPVDFSNVSIGSVDSCNSDFSSVSLRDSSSLVSVRSNGASQSLYSRENMREKKRFLHKLEELPWESQCKRVEDIRCLLKEDDQASYSISFENFVRPLVVFLSSARDADDIKAQRTGIHLLSLFVETCRSQIPLLHDEVYTLLASFLDSELIEESLATLEVLSCSRTCRAKIAASGAPFLILKVLESDIREFREPAVKILYNLSSSSEFASLIPPSELIPKLVPLLQDVDCARYCMSVLKNLCDDEVSRTFIAESNGCVSSIAGLLDIESQEVQEHAVSVLLSLCSQRVDYCEMVMEEGVIPALVSISINGSEKGQVSAMELLRVLRDTEYGEEQNVVDTHHPHEEYVQRTVHFGNHPEEKKPSTKTSGFFGVKISIFSKRRK